ncbi:MAG: hypothetical protein PHD95_01455 [Candidatus ainarchaeum sp.]|nr:hypothetical protein [Candidatus ainarchaeum sp.]
MRGMRRLKRIFSKPRVSHLVGSERIPGLAQAGLTAIGTGNAIRVPIETDRKGRTKDFNKDGNCAGYAVRVAKIIFGLDYEKGHAWDLAKWNHLSLRLATKTGWGSSRIERPVVPLEKIENHLVPGCLLGIYLPWSPEQISHPRRLYTHTVLYLGKRNGTHWVMHNMKGPVFQPLEELLDQGKTKGILVDVILPGA